MELIKYGVATIIRDIPLVDNGATDFVASVTIAAGDAKLYTDRQAGTNLTAEAVAFTSGSEEPTKGDTIVGATSTETATYIGHILTSGSWSGADAAGTLFIEDDASGAFQNEDINIQGGSSNVLTIGADFTTGLFGDQGGGLYAFPLTSTETSCAKGAINIIDSATKEWEDQAVRFQTYGNASAEHAFDLDTATQNVNATQISGSATAANNAEVVFDTDFATNYSTANDKWQTEADVLSISGDSTAADNLESAYDGTGYDLGGIDVSVLNTAATAIGSDGTGLTEAGGTGDQFTGLPEVTADAVKISGSSTAADNAEAMFDGTGYAGGTTKLGVDVVAVSGDSSAADALEAVMDGTIVAQVNDASATTTAFAADGFTEATDDHFNGRLITFITGNLAGQQTDITDYDAADHAQGPQAFVVTALTEAPANDDYFVVT